MDSATTTRDRRGGALWVTLGLLAVSNIASNRLLPATAYVPWNLAVAVALVVLARRLDQATWADIGLDRRHLATGLRWGLGLAAAVAVVFLIAVSVPDLRDLFKDRRVGQRSAAAMAGEVLLRIPFGTALLEEVAFRGVLLGQLRRRVGVGRAALGSALAFGCWHILPAWGINTVNPVVRDAGVGRVTAVVSAVLATGLAGLPMAWLRLRSRHVVSSFLLHVATNSGGFLVAWLVLR
jgi:uncharacterized protein